MTIAQIKNYLEFFINNLGKKSNMENAKKDWENDLAYLNELGIKKNKNK